MSYKSVVDIDFNSDSFKEFKSLFDKYREAVKQLPAAWGETNRVATATGAAYRDQTAALLAQAEIIHRAGQDQEKMRREVETAGRAWQGIARSTKSVAADIFGATEKLLKWSTIIGAAGGLLGAGGGLWGFNKLANDASNSRRAALSVGTSIGSKRAFEIAYGNVIDTDTFLQNVSAIPYDNSKNSIGYGAEVKHLHDKGLGTADIASIILPKILNQFHAVGGMGPAGRQMFESFHLGDFATFEQFQLALRQRGELGADAGRYNKIKGQVGLSDAEAQLYQEVEKQFETSGSKVVTTLQRGLIKLASPLGHLSDAVAGLVTKVIQNPNTGHLINEAANGIERFASYIASPSFKSDLHELSDDIERFGEKVKSVAQILGIIPKDTPDASKAADAGSALPAAADDNSMWAKMGRSLDWQPNNGADNLKQFSEAMKFVEQKKGLPPGLLSALATGESGGNSWVTSPRGARGPFQFMEGTWKKYGSALSLPEDFGPSAHAAGDDLADLSKKYGGDTAKIIAAYNWGEGNLDKDIAQNGSSWGAHLPAETVQLLRRIAENTQGKAKSDIKVIFPAPVGANPVVVGNQVAQ